MLKEAFNKMGPLCFFYISLFYSQKMRLDELIPEPLARLRIFRKTDKIITKTLLLKKKIHKASIFLKSLR